MLKFNEYPRIQKEETLSEKKSQFLGQYRKHCSQIFLLSFMCCLPMEFKKLYLYVTCISLQDDKIIDLSKFKAFVDNIPNVSKTRAATKCDLIHKPAL